MQHLSSAQKQVIQIAIAALLLIGCIAVLMPFTGTLLLATVICVTTAPAHKFILAKCRGRSNLAAALMCLLMVLLLVVPMAILSGSLASGVEMAIAYIRPLLESGLPMHVPKRVSNLPIAGSMIEDYWHALLASREELNELLRQFIAPTRKMALATVSMFGQGLFQLVLVIFFAFFILRDADTYTAALRTASHKLAGNLGDRMFRLVNGTITGVMAGIVGTAAAQALVAMIGFIIAGVPGIIILTVATFFFSMVPVIGATLIWGGAAVWLYETGQTGWAIFMVLWGMFGISSVDNFLKPFLISRTSSLPLLLIVVGVFGGVLVFGFIGLFLGPTLLALGQVLIREWLDHVDYDHSPSI